MQPTTADVASEPSVTLHAPGLGVSRHCPMTGDHCSSVVCVQNCPVLHSATGADSGKDCGDCGGGGGGASLSRPQTHFSAVASLPSVLLQTGVLLHFVKLAS